MTNIISIIKSLKNYFFYFYKKNENININSINKKINKYVKKILKSNKKNSLESELKLLENKNLLDEEQIPIISDSDIEAVFNEQSKTIIKLIVQYAKIMIHQINNLIKDEDIYSSLPEENKKIIQENKEKNLKILINILRFCKKI